MTLPTRPAGTHHRSARARTRLTVCALAVGLALAAPAVAQASTWTEGTSARAFGLSGVQTTRLGPLADPKGGQSLVLPYMLVTQNPGSGINPRSIQSLGDGRILVADWDNYRVYEVTSAGTIGWTYDTLDGLTLHRPIAAWRIPGTYGNGGGNTLVVDRAGYQVIEVTPTKTRAWTYGQESLPGTGYDRLSDPWWAVRLSNGHTLIADGAGSNRVIEVSSTEGTITWQYGATGVSGTGANRLVLPTSAERLANGNTLIADSGGNRVIEVKPDKTIAWQYGAGKLSSPHHATRLANGNTLITDNGNKRIIEVDGKGVLVASYGSGVQLPSGGGLSNPWTSTRLDDGTTLVADPGNARIFRYGYAPSGTAESKQIDCGSSGVRKKFLSVTWRGTAPAGTRVEVSYSIDGSTYKAVPASGKLPTYAVGTYMRYKVTLRRGTFAMAPVLSDISIGYQVASTTSGYVTYPSAGTNTSTGTGTGTASGTGTGTVNPSFVGTASVGTTGTTTETVVDDGTRRGFVMAEVPAGGGGQGPKLKSVNASAPLATQLAGLGLLVLALTIGAGLGPLRVIAPRLVHMAGTLLN